MLGARRAGRARAAAPSPGLPGVRVVVGHAPRAGKEASGGLGVAWTAARVGVGGRPARSRAPRWPPLSSLSPGARRVGAGTRAQQGAGAVASGLAEMGFDHATRSLNESVSICPGLGRATLTRGPTQRLSRGLRTGHTESRSPSAFRCEPCSSGIDCIFPFPMTKIFCLSPFRP